MLAGVDAHTTPVGQWCDAAWAAFVEYNVALAAAGGPQVGEAIDSTWQQIVGQDVAGSVGPVEPGAAPQQAAPRPSSQTAPMRFDPPIDPETGQPRRPTAAEREAWALQSAAAGTNDLLGSARSGARGAADRVGG